MSVRGKRVERRSPLWEVGGGGILVRTPGGKGRGNSESKALHQQSKGESGSFRVTGQADPEPGACKNR